MAQFLKHLKVVGLFGRYDIDVEFSKGINVVHGVNGSGKTTVLHILANATRLDLARFSELMFQSIELDISSGPRVALIKRDDTDGPDPLGMELRIDGEDVSGWPEFPDDFGYDDDFAYAHGRQVSEFRKRAGISIESTYFPAFRTMHDAWSSLDLSDLFRNDVGRRSAYQSGRNPRERAVARRRAGRGLPESVVQTMLTREIFGDFVPPADYPSSQDIQRNLDGAIQLAVNRLATGDRSLLSDAFSKVFSAISDETGTDQADGRTTETIRSAIGEQLEHLQDLQSEYGLAESDTAFGALRIQMGSAGAPGQSHDDTTRRVLSVYEEVLSQREENLNRAFATVRTYIDAVNDFLDGKQLVAAMVREHDTTPRLWVRHSDDSLSRLDTLSSGERQIAGLIYAATHLAQGDVVLVDEPELSLHVDWQRTIIQAMLKQLPNKQLIVCTHSPAIGSSFIENMVPLLPRPTIVPSNEGYWSVKDREERAEEYLLEDN